MHEKNTVISPPYGTSLHYTGNEGLRYFEWQSVSAQYTSHFEADKFRHVVRDARSLLDFGCGGGWLLNTLTAKRKVGVEINPIARSAAAQLGLKVYESTAELEGEAFDHIISNHCLEHVPFPIGALKNLREFAAKGCQLVIAVPVDDWRTQKNYSPKDIHNHLHTWTPQLLGNTITEAKWQVKSISILNSAYPPGVQRLHNLPAGPVSRFIFYISSMLLRRRQIMAVATPK